ncbi:MAG: N-6 DNA methylase [Acidobacteria bacterium]|nr:N-6 DNA methylase [Acidobacteriota bacterium]
MNGKYGRLNVADLRPHLMYCGYDKSQLVANVPLTEGRQVSLAAFAHSPHDSRSACIAVVESISDPETDVVACRSLGAPLVFMCRSNELWFWKQRADKPQFVSRIPEPTLPRFFEKHRNEFSPESVYRAKTWARFDKYYQLDFVDVGLMPVVEAEAGRRLSKFIERVVVETKSRLGWKEVSEEQGHWLLKANFWLLAAKILKDKHVPGFITLDFENLDNVFARVAKHYGSDVPVTPGSKRQASALQESAREISRFGSLALVSTEALAYLYERALITRETRTELGTHSTPAYLVDYIVGKLRPWIEAMDIEDRQVFEPACGHAAFLLAAMRLLLESTAVDSYPPSERHNYLRDRLHGSDTDSFALEIARLSLTLADVPNPNGWDLQEANMFRGDHLARRSREADIILANPPFENFSQGEQRLSAADSTTNQYVNKAAEMLWRVITNMNPGAVFGVVLPQGILHSKNAASLRQFLATNFEISEICLFPDKVFTFSDAGSAVILGRRLPRESGNNKPILYRHIRESDAANFKLTYQGTRDFEIQQSRFSDVNEWSFFVPSLEEVWEFCREMPRFGDIVEMGKGLEFLSMSNPLFPKNAITESHTQFNDSVRGFARLRHSLLTHQKPDIVWLNLSPSVIRSSGLGATTGMRQVLLNYARVSREEWRLKAFLDEEGHPVTTRFLVIRPKDKKLPIEVLWGICNSPFANAFSYSYSTKRDVLAGLMRLMPVPDVRSKNLAPLLNAVMAYLKAARSEDILISPTFQDELKTLHWRVDAEVLRLYELPPRLERQLLNLFSGVKRRGVPFEQYEYFPKEFKEPLTLIELLMITADWEKTNERRAELIFKKVKKGISPEESAELNELQRLADARIRLIAPLPIAQMEAAMEGLKGREMWEGN